MRRSTQAVADELNAAWENAQANASRAGDEALSCDQLEMELDSGSSDPTIQQKLASLDAGAQEAMRRYENAKTLGMALGKDCAFMRPAVMVASDATTHRTWSWVPL